MYMYFLCHIIKKEEQRYALKKKYKMAYEILWKHWFKILIKILIIFNLVLSKRLQKFWSRVQLGIELGMEIFNTISKIFENFENHKRNVFLIKQCTICLKYIILRFNLNVQFNQWFKLILQGNFSSLHNRSCSAEIFGKILGKLLIEFVKEKKTSIIVYNFFFDLKNYYFKFKKGELGGKIMLSFLETFGRKFPRFTLKNVLMIVSHANCQPWQIRAGITSMLTNLLVKVKLKIKNVLNINVKDFKKRRRKLQMGEKISNHLLTRTDDINVYTRSRVLKHWIRLIKIHKISALSICIQIAPMTVYRLLDKTSSVRIAALDLLSSILIYNPFDLNGNERFNQNIQKNTLKKISKNICYKTNKLEKKKKKLIYHNFTEQEYFREKKYNFPKQKNVKFNLDVIRVAYRDLKEYLFEKKLDIFCALRQEEIILKFLKKKKKTRLTPEKKLYIQKLKMLEWNRSIRQNFILLIKILNKGGGIVSRLLYSTNVNDIYKTIEFFQRADAFYMSCAQKGFENMLSIVIDREDPNILEAVLFAFNNRYFLNNKKNSFLSDEKSVEIAISLCRMLKNIDLAYLTSFEYFIKIWTSPSTNKIFNDKCQDKIHILNKKPTIPIKIFRAFWSIFCNKSFKNGESSYSLKFLDAASRTNSIILSKKIYLLIREIQKSNEDENPILFKFVLESLCTISIQLRSDEILRKKVIKTLRSFFLGKINPAIWYSIAETAVSLIYKIHIAPLKFMNEIVKLFYYNLKKPVGDLTLKLQYSLDIIRSKFFNILGSIALQTLKYVEILQVIVRKRKRFKKFFFSRENSKINYIENLNKFNKVMTNCRRKNKKKHFFSQKKIDVLGKESLLFSSIEIIKQVLRLNRFRQYKSLFRQALLCFCKFMIVDKNICEANLSLLFYILKNENCFQEDKSNIIIALSDMCCRFPNELDKVLENIFIFLNNKEIELKKISLLVLSHLILNDMIKIHTFISDLVLLVEDEIEEIKFHAKFFFTELSKKNENHIYNILPDVISTLSEKTISQLSEKKFQKIIRYIFNFINKTKQTENLLEKILRRMSITNFSNRRLTYCLSQILGQKSNKPLKKLMDPEIMKLYISRLGEDEIWKTFESIICDMTKLRSLKNNSNQSNQVEMWEKKILEARLKGKKKKEIKNRIENIRDNTIIQNINKCKSTLAKKKVKIIKYPGMSKVWIKKKKIHD